MATMSDVWDMVNISKTTIPCPICGKQDYCFFRQHRVDGNREYFCHRTASENDVVGIDGNVYFFKRSSEGANAKVFESEEDRKRRGGKVGSGRAVNRPDFQLFGERTVEGEEKVATEEERDVFFRRLAEVMSLSEKHQEALKEDWNTPATPDLFERVANIFPILSLPPADYIADIWHMPTLRRRDIARAMSKDFDITRFPGFVINSKNEKTIVGPEGILFPIYNKDRKLISFRVRADYPDKKGVWQGNEGVFSHSYNKKGEQITLFYKDGNKEVIDLPWSKVQGKTQNKYKNLSGVFEKREGEKLINGYGIGCRVGSLISLYTTPGDNMSIVFITEGEKKAMVSNILSHYPCISVPGVNAFSKIFEKDSDGESMMGSLVKRGCKMAVVCYDADKAANQDVLRAQNGLASALAESNISVGIGEWDANWGKGLDDVLVRGIKPVIYPIKF